VASAGFFAIAEREPGRPALVDPSGRRLSYGELAAGADRLARGLRAAGLQPGDAVAVALPNGAEAAEVFAAAMQSGLCYVPLNWHLTAGELAYILDNCGARAVVGHERFAVAIGEAARQVDVRLRVAVGRVDGFRPLAEIADAGDSSPEPDRRAGQVLFYTSGTTGHPKGVRKRLPPVDPERVGLASGIGLAVPDLATALGSDAVSLVGGPLYHAAPLAALAGGLDSGAEVVLMERWTPEGFLDLVARHRVTQATMVPTMFHRLLSLPDEVRLAADVSSLRSIMHAGAPCPVDVKRRMIDWLGPIIVEGYSSTEGAGTMVTSEEWLARPGTVGRPSPGVVLKIVDDDGNECPPGVPGRVFLSQALWEFEYLGDADQTRANRRGDLFTVGDIGYVDEDGYLYLCDRVAQVIISGGVNIYPAEVEAILLEHPAVADVAVIGAPNDEWGEEVRAVVQPQPGHDASGRLERELIEHCRARIAHFKCPVAVDFVDDLGRDPNGKLRKGPIRDRYWQGRARHI